MKRHGLMALMLGGALMALPASAAQNGEMYKARLSPVPIDISMQANVAGLGNLTATLVGNKLTINGNFDGLKSPATEAHINRGPKGIPGPSIHDLTIQKATSGSITGSVDLTPTEVDDLKNERLYVQLSSERAPDGNLRGWILR
jgi:CHRD domain-containing protein